MVDVGIEAAVGNHSAVLQTLFAVLVVNGLFQGIREDLVGLGHGGEGVERILAVVRVSGQTLRVESKGQTSKSEETFELT